MDYILGDLKSTLRNTLEKSIHKTPSNLYAAENEL